MLNYRALIHVYARNAPPVLLQQRRPFALAGEIRDGDGDGDVTSQNHI